MADGSISGNSRKAVEEYEETTWFYFPPSPEFFSSLDFPPSPPVEFPWSPRPSSSYSRPVLPLAFDGSQPPMENPHQFTTNSHPLLPPPPQNQQLVISPAPQHQDNVFPQYLLVMAIVADTVAPEALERQLEHRIHSRRGRMMVTNSRASGAVLAAESEAKWASGLAAVRALRGAVSAGVSAAISADVSAAESDPVSAALSAAKSAALSAAELAAVPETVSAAELAAVPAVASAALGAALSCLLGYWTDGLNCTRRMMMKNSRGEQSIPISREGLNIVVTQRHGGDRVTEIRHPRHRLCTFDTAEEVALAIDQAGCKLRGENARLNFPNLFLDQNRAAESTAPPRTKFPPTPPQQLNPEEDPGSGRSEAMAAAADNEVEGLGWGSGTGEGVRRKIQKIENKKTRGVRITIPWKDILKYSEMKLEDAAKNLKVSRSTLKRVIHEVYKIPRWPPRIPQLNSNDLQHGPSNQASSSSPVVHTNQPQLSYAEKQPDTDPGTEMHLSSFKQPNDRNTVTVKAKYVDGRNTKFRMPWPSSGLVELEQNVKKRLDLEAGTYHIKYKDEEDDLIIIACDEDFQDYVCDARLEGNSMITVFLEPKQPINYPSNNLNLVN